MDAEWRVYVLRCADGTLYVGLARKAWIGRRIQQLLMAKGVTSRNASSRPRCVWFGLRARAPWRLMLTSGCSRPSLGIVAREWVGGPKRARNSAPWRTCWCRRRGVGWKDAALHVVVVTLPMKSVLVKDSSRRVGIYANTAARSCTSRAGATLPTSWRRRPNLLFRGIVCRAPSGPQMQRQMSQLCPQGSDRRRRGPRARVWTFAGKPTQP